MKYHFIRELFLVLTKEPSIVGGMPTVATKIDLVKIAGGCGYHNAVFVNNFSSLNKELKLAKFKNELSFIEVKCFIGARDNLGRPTTTVKENK